MGFMLFSDRGSRGYAIASCIARLANVRQTCRELPAKNSPQRLVKLRAEPVAGNAILLSRLGYG
jgi:hypothetical protein